MDSTAWPLCSWTQLHWWHHANLWLERILCTGWHIALRPPIYHGKQILIWCHQTQMKPQPLPLFPITQSVVTNKTILNISSPEPKREWHHIMLSYHSWLWSSFIIYYLSIAYVTVTSCHYATACSFMWDCIAQRGRSCHSIAPLKLWWHVTICVVWHTDTDVSPDVSYQH